VALLDQCCDPDYACRKEMIPAMRPLILLLLMLAGCSQPVSVIQPQSARSILDQAAAAFRKEEPSWTLESGLCTCPRLIDEQTGVVVGTWWLGGIFGPEIATVTVYEISSARAASRWLQNYGGRVAVGWTVEPYELGVRSYITTYRDRERFAITSGKGRFLLQVEGPSRQQVDRIAKYLLRQIESER
jgi:hypothetical protein